MDPSQFKVINWSQPVFTVIKDQLYQLTQAYVVSWLYLNDTYRTLIPKDDETDGASSPPWTSALGITPVGLDFGPAVWHDDAYGHQGAFPAGSYQVHRNGQWENVPDVWTRAQCDAMFKTLLLAAGVPQWKAWAMYLAVRSCGWLFWSRALKTAAG